MQLLFALVLNLIHLLAGVGLLAFAGLLALRLCVTSPANPYPARKKRAALLGMFAAALLAAVNWYLVLGLFGSTSMQRTPELRTATQTLAVLGQVAQSVRKLPGSEKRVTFYEGREMAFVGTILEKPSYRVDIELRPIRKSYSPDSYGIAEVVTVKTYIKQDQIVEYHSTPGSDGTSSWQLILRDESSDAFAQPHWSILAFRCAWTRPSSYREWLSDPDCADEARRQRDTEALEVLVAHLPVAQAALEEVEALATLPNELTKE